MVAVVEAERLSKRYGRLRALEDLSFKIERGSIFALLGPNGSGKTTTIRILMGLVKQDSGNFTILGEDPKLRRDVYARVGYSPEMARLPDFLSAERFLELVGRLHRIPEGERKRRIREVLELVGLMRAPINISSYSKGMLQRLGIAQALLPRPELLILDEPTLGMDPEGRIYFRQLFLKLRREEGVTILLSSHLLDEVERLCDEVAILHQGRLVALGPLEEILGSKGGRSLIVRLQEPLAGVREALEAIEGVDAVREVEDSELEVLLREGCDARPSIFKTIRDLGGVVIEMRLTQRRLEEAYLKALGYAPR